MTHDLSVFFWAGTLFGAAMGSSLTYALLIGRFQKEHDNFKLDRIEDAFTPKPVAEKANDLCTCGHARWRHTADKGGCISCSATLCNCSKFERQFEAKE